MVKFLALVGVLILLFIIFGWATLIPGVIGGVILAIWLVRRDSAKQESSMDAEWFVEENGRGNRFMIGDALDLPGATTEEERKTLRRDLLGGLIFQKSAGLLAWRQRILNEPGFLATPQGIEAVNAIGGAAFDLANDAVRNWKTNDFRKLGIEILLE